jgi:cell division protein FtsZ
MGGGTGTGAAPVVARLAREQGILTVGVVTKPFHFEGTHRMRVAELGLQELQKYVDTMIVIPNQNLFRIADKNTTFLEAFKLADSVLKSGVKGVTDLMVMPGLINLDFADVRSVMSEMGKAMMGTGESEGENRAIKAAEAAIANPLLDNVSMQGARGVLINITGGADMTLFEVDEAANRIREEVDENANIIFGSTFDMGLDGKIRVSVVATGIDVDNSAYTSNPNKPNSTPVSRTLQEAPKPAQNFRELEEAEEMSNGKTFIGREPVEPQTYRPQQPERSVESFARPQTRNAQPAQQQPASQQGNGLFGSLFSRREDEVTATPVQQAPQQPKSQQKTQEDELDIPAFMRRKV